MLLSNGFEGQAAGWRLPIELADCRLGLSASSLLKLCLTVRQCFDGQLADWELPIEILKRPLAEWGMAISKLAVSAVRVGAGNGDPRPL